MNISNRIQVLRKRKGLTQSEFGNLLGKTLRTVQKYESGEIEPSLTVIEQMASILDVSLADMLGIVSDAPAGNTSSFYELVLKELEFIKGMDIDANDEHLKVAGALVVLRDYLSERTTTVHS